MNSKHTLGLWAIMRGSRGLNCTRLVVILSSFGECRGLGRTPKKNHNFFILHNTSLSAGTNFAKSDIIACWVTDNRRSI